MAEDDPENESAADDSQNQYGGDSDGEDAVDQTERMEDDDGDAA